MTSGISLTLTVADALTNAGIPYLLTGSFASNYYGTPRSTSVADFVIQLPGPLSAAFGQHLDEDFVVDPQLSFETVTGTYRQLVHHRRSRFKIELFLLSEAPYDQERFRRRVEIKLFDRTVWLLTAEDVIVSKLQWGRNKDGEDIRSVIAVQGGNLDWSYIDTWCRRHGTMTLLTEIRRSIPEI